MSIIKTQAKKVRFESAGQQKRHCKKAVAAVPKCSPLVNSLKLDPLNQKLTQNILLIYNYCK